jgi:hypothetical protein
MHYRVAGAVWLVFVLAGCGDRGRLQYSALRVARMGSGTVEIAKEMKAKLDALEIAEDDAWQRDSLSECAARLEHLGNTIVQQGQILQVYHGSPTDVEVVLGNDKDNYEVVALAGAATNRHARRGWFGRKLEDLAKGVAQFAARLGGTAVHTVAKEFIPWWVWWILVLPACLVAVCMLLYGLWQRIRVRQKDRAIDEYDDAVEMLPFNVRFKIGKGRSALQKEHAPRNDLRKARISENPIPADHPLTLPTASEMMPGL